MAQFAYQSGRGDSCQRLRRSAVRLLASTTSQHPTTPEHPACPDFQEIRRRAKTGILTTSRTTPNRIAAVNSQATTASGNGAMAKPKIASVEMIRMSATDDSTSQTLGRNRSEER